MRASFKVELTKAEKKSIGKATMPRLELDLIAYKGQTNQLLVVECKAFLDSPGVRYAGFDGSSERYANRYKLFNSAKMRNIVFDRLKQQLTARDTCRKNPRVQLALAAGKIISEADRQALQSHFDNNNWLLFDSQWLNKRLEKAAEAGYENDVAFIVSKLLLRKRSKPDESRP
jgi:hypothetical protein